ncbi:hypothetical protein MNBD_NITROSPINAE02-607 [hydrothermal vent metagenome]|uniref:PilZ domain-containing protein n=1 Tax=hydrothermal vent metagenome TaxID=652676 RepID=A0A3B1BLI2_9ZZZZ
MSATTNQMLALGEEMSLEADGRKANVHIRGWREGSYMLVESPDPTWIAKAGDSIIGRLLFRGTYYGFETSVVGQLPEVKILVLSYPANTVETVYRKEDRFSTTIPVIAYKENDKETGEFQGMIVNISQGGCRLLCSKRFEPDETLVLNGMLPNGGEIKELNFAIAHIIKENGKYQYGGRFVTLREAHKSALKDFFEINDFFNESERVGEYVQKDQINIPVGGICIIQAGKSRYRSIFRGSDFPRYAFMDMPIVNGKPVTLGHHEECIIRFQNSGIVYGFETEVVKQYSRPIPMWVLNYPGNMEKVSLRKSERVQTFLPATMVSNGDEQKGAVIDLSIGGCQFVLGGGEAEPGSECLLHMALPDGVKIGGLACEVKNIRESNSKKFAGLVFSDMDGPDTRKMNSFYSLCKEWV